MPTLVRRNLTGAPYTPVNILLSSTASASTQSSLFRNVFANIYNAIFSLMPKSIHSYKAKQKFGRDFKEIFRRLEFSPALFLRNKTDAYWFINYIILTGILIAWSLYDRLHDDHAMAFSPILIHPLDIIFEKKQGFLEWSQRPPVHDHFEDPSIKFKPGSPGKNHDNKNYQFKFQNPGYVSIKPGTFRDTYPSVSSGGRGTFDEVYVITNEKCTAQFNEFKSRADAIQLKFQKIIATSSKQITLENPPIKVEDTPYVSNAMKTKPGQASLRRNIGYTFTHMKIWDTVVSKKKQRVLILDDTLFPKERLIRIWPSLFNWVDQESVAGQQPWHFMFFRRKILQEDWDAKNESFWSGEEETWSPNPKYNHPVVRAKPSYGAGFYALSFQGAQWMLDHFDSYKAPLDVQISMLQRQYPQEFIALSACNNDEVQTFCPEIVQEISAIDQQYDCIWRRMQEVQAARDNSNNNQED